VSYCPYLIVRFKKTKKKKTLKECQATAYKIVDKNTFLNQPQVVDKDCRLFFNHQVIRHLETDKIFYLIKKKERETRRFL
jgi:hypothetical protein